MPFLVLVYGSPAGFFRGTRGWRQGDPLCPFLFVIGMEILSRPINRATKEGSFAGYRFKARGEEAVLVSHQLFADDTLIFCSDSRDEMACLGWTLMWFEAAFGLRMNLEKIVILPIGGWCRGCWGVGFGVGLQGWSSPVNLFRTTFGCSW